MDATFDRRELFEWLAAYEAAMDLMAIGVLAGGRRVASCPSLGDFQDEYRRVVTAGQAPVGRLAAAHRRMVLALRDLRDARSDHGARTRELEQARREHGAIVAAVLAELRTPTLARAGKA